MNNIKAGAVYEQTFLRENDSLGVVYPTYNSPCVDVSGNPLPGYSDPAECAGEARDHFFGCGLDAGLGADLGLDLGAAFGLSCPPPITPSRFFSTR